MTRAEFEAALDAKTLLIREQFATGDRWYAVRRNGRTRTWVRDPSRFSIPIKWKLNKTTRVNEANFESGLIVRWFRRAQ